MAVLPVGQIIYRPQFNTPNTHTLSFQQDNFYSPKLNINENGYYSIKYYQIDVGKPQETTVIFDGGQNLHDVVDILFDGGWVKEAHGE